MSTVPKNRIDVLPHYSRLIATLNKYMPDIGSEIVSVVGCCINLGDCLCAYAHMKLDDEFRYLQRKKNVVKEMADMRRKVWLYE